MTASECFSAKGRSSARRARSASPTLKKARRLASSASSNRSNLRYFWWSMGEGAKEPRGHHAAGSVVHAKGGRKPGAPEHARVDPRSVLGVFPRALGHGDSARGPGPPGALRHRARRTRSRASGARGGCAHAARCRRGHGRGHRRRARTRGGDRRLPDRRSGLFVRRRRDRARARACDPGALPEGWPRALRRPLGDARVRWCAFRILGGAAFGFEGRRRSQPQAALGPRRPRRDPAGLGSALRGAQACERRSSSLARDPGA
jgi:hypothetical protein